MWGRNVRSTNAKVIGNEEEETFRSENRFDGSNAKSKVASAFSSRCWTANERNTAVVRIAIFTPSAPSKSGSLPERVGNEHHVMGSRMTNAGFCFVTRARHQNKRQSLPAIDPIFSEYDWTHTTSMLNRLYIKHISYLCYIVDIYQLELPPFR